MNFKEVFFLKVHFFAFFRRVSPFSKVNDNFYQKRPVPTRTGISLLKMS